jgi:hypothetical protein
MRRTIIRLHFRGWRTRNDDTGTNNGCPDDTGTNNGCPDDTGTNNGCPDDTGTIYERKISQCV